MFLRKKENVHQKVAAGVLPVAVTTEKGGRDNDATRESAGKYAYSELRTKEVFETESGVLRVPRDKIAISEYM